MHSEYHVTGADPLYEVLSRYGVGTSALLLPLRRQARRELGLGHVPQGAMRPLMIVVLFLTGRQRERAPGTPFVWRR